MTKERREKLEAEWKSCGRRAVYAWKQSGGGSAKIDELFARMDRIGDMLGRKRSSSRGNA